MTKPTAAPPAAPCPCRVPLEEVATATGWPGAAALALRLAAAGFEVEPDWAGRPSVAVADAAGAVAEVRGQKGEHA